MSCVVCGSIDNLQKHHINYDPTEIVILCRDCHKELHGHAVGLATRIVKPIPEDFAESFKSQTYKELIKKYNISNGTVYNWAKKLGLTLKNPRRRSHSFMFNSTNLTCPDCGGKMMLHGIYITKTFRGKRFRCTMCGTTVSGKLFE